MGHLFALEVVSDIDVMVTTRDGVSLGTDIYRPVGQGPWPVVVNRDPAPHRTPGSGLIARGIAALGYVVVNQQVRPGSTCGASAEIAAQEREDLWDLLDWVGCEPWSNGQVGIYGSSCCSMESWIDDGLDTPHLVAVAPAPLHPMDDRRPVIHQPSREDAGKGMTLRWTAEFSADGAKDPKHPAMLEVLDRQLPAIDAGQTDTGAVTTLRPPTWRSVTMTMDRRVCTASKAKAAIHTPVDHRTDASLTTDAASWVRNDSADPVVTVDPTSPLIRFFGEHLQRGAVDIWAEPAITLQILAPTG